MGFPLFDELYAAPELLSYNVQPQGDNLTVPDAVYSIVGNRPLDGAVYPSLLNGGELSNDVGLSGQAIVCNVTDAIITGANTGKRIGVNGNFILIIVARWDVDNGRASGTLFGTSGASPARGFAFQLEIFPNNLYVGVRNVKPDDTVEELLATDLVTSADGTTHVYGMRVESNGATTVFMDGVKSSVSATFSYAEPPHNSFLIGGRDSASAEFRFSGGIYFISCIIGARTNEYVRQLTLNPYQLLKPVNSGIWLPDIAAVGGVTVPIMSHHYTKNIGAGR